MKKFTILRRILLDFLKEISYITKERFNSMKGDGRNH